MLTLREELLQLDPRQALVLMINEENGTEFSIYDLEFDPPTVVVGPDPTLTDVVVRARPAAFDTDVDFTATGTSFTYRYRRLDIGNIYRGLLTGFYPPIPSSTQVLVNEIARLREGHVLTLEDFVQRDISSLSERPFILEAKAESWRFVGTLEVDVVDLIPLSSLEIEDALDASLHPDKEPQLRSLTSALPYLDATDFNRVINAANFDITQEVPYNPDLFDILTKTLRVDARMLGEASGATPVNGLFVQSSQAAAYNLYNARIEEKGVGVRHPSNPHLDLYLKISLADCPGLSLWLDDPELYLPYRKHVEVLNEYDIEGRIASYAEFITTDGTAYQEYLANLNVGDKLTASLGITDFQALSLDPRHDFEISDAPSPGNLKDAVVMYNAERPQYYGVTMADKQRQDLGDAPLDRGIELALSPVYNTHYQGNLRIPYPALVRSVKKLSNVVRGAAYSETISLASLNPNSASPFNLSVINGSLAPGHAIVDLGGGDFAIQGTSAVLGNYAVTLRATDGEGRYTDYRYRYSVYAVALTLQGNAPPMPSNQPYSYTYVATGGQAPYRFTIVAGSCPYVLDPDTGELNGYPSGTGAFTWTAAVQDADGSIALLADSVTVS